jgi:hypothetical protein
MLKCFDDFQDPHTLSPESAALLVDFKSSPIPQHIHTSECFDLSDLLHLSIGSSLLNTISGRRMSGGRCMVLQSGYSGFHEPYVVLGGVPDYHAAAVNFISMYRKGKLGTFYLDS